MSSEVLSAVASPPVVAIDSPRSPSSNPDGKWGRECERKVMKLGTPPQWTPPAEYFKQPGHDKEWMEIGFRIFEEFERLKAAGSVKDVIEVFPSASYGRFGDLAFAIPIKLFNRKAKTDQLDAVCCALTAWRYAQGYYDAYGSKEEGQIIVPAFDK